MKPLLTACLLILIAFQVNAQNIISGTVFQKGSSIRVADATVTNLKQQISSRSNGLGAFSIIASMGDTIKITKPGFMDQNVVISAFTELVIQLARPVQLSEVRVTGQSKKQELDEVKRQYRRKGSYYAGKPPLLSYIFTPLTALYELVGKTPGQARRFNRYYSRELQESEIDRRFNPHSVNLLTGYEGADLRNFVETYRPPFSLLVSWEDYDLVNYIKRSVLAFESAGRPAAKPLPVLPRAPDLSEKIVIKD